MTDGYAAEPGSRVKSCRQPRHTRPREKASEQSEIHPAGQVDVALREFVERAVEEPDLALALKRAVAGIAEQRAERCGQARQARVAANPPVRLMPERATVFFSGSV